MPTSSRFARLRSHLNRLLIIGGLALGLAAPARAGGTGPGGAAGNTPNLSAALNPDGTLRAGAAGSFDARQFTMSTAPDGRPVFRPAGARRTAGASDDRWREGFGPAFSVAGVRAVVQMGTDVYIGGRFNAVGTIKANNIAKWNGTSWSTLGNGTNDVVTSLAVLGSDLYVGGDFVEAGGAAAKRLAKWNGTSWSPLGAGLGSGTVSALAVLGSDLYVGGTFTSTIGGITAYGIAKWTPASSTWSSLGTGTANGLLNGASVSGGSAQALAVSGTDLYVGGTFTKAGAVAASNVAKWSTTSSTWSALGAGVDDGTANSGSVSAIAVAGSNVYVGGFVSRVNGNLAVNSVARWNGTTWSGMGSGLKIYVAGVADARVPVYALAVSGSNVYAAGDFNTAGGNTAIANGVALWNGSAWSSLGSGTANGIGMAAAVGGAGAGRALAVASGGGVYVGGYFEKAGGVAQGDIARWDGSTWSGLGTGVRGTSTNSIIYAVAVAGSDVYVGGIFSEAGDVLASRIAKWSGSTGTWSALGTGLDASGGTGAPFQSQVAVYALAVLGTDLYVGGAFNKIGGVTANGIAKWNGTAWSALGTGLDGGNFGRYASSLVVSGNDLYMAGNFTTVNGVAASYVAKYTPATGTWSGLGSGLGGETAKLAAAPNGDIYVVGYFSTAGGAAANRVARWNGTAWSTLGTGLNNNANAIAIDAAGTAVYVGGSFTTAGGSTANSIAKWTPATSTWSSLGTGTANGVTGAIYALAVAGPNVYVGGSLSAAGGLATRDIAKWSGTAWSSLGTGLTSPSVAQGFGSQVNALAVGPGRFLNAGGAFDRVGDGSKASQYFGIYDDTPAPTVTSFTPPSGVAGTSVTITGTDLTGATAVAFNGTAASGYVVNAAGTSITVSVPAGASSGLISVTTPGGSAASASSFVVIPPAPAITSFSPPSGVVGASVTLTGTDLTGATAVTFNSTAAPGYVVNAAGTSITVNVPAGASSGPLAVTTAGGTGTSSTAFTVTLPVPALSTISPGSGPVGTRVTLTGTALGAALSVSFNGTVVGSAALVSNSATEVVVNVPAGATTGPVTVSTANGTSNGLTFTVPPVIVLTSISPGSGAVGSYLTLNGSLLAGATAINFAGASVSTGFVVNAAGTQITNVRVPAGTSSGPVTVTTPSGTSNGVYFYLLQPPSVSSFSPYYSYSGGRTRFFGFFRRPAGTAGKTAAVPPVTAVYFNGVAAAFTIISATELEATVPVGATSGPVILENADGNTTTARDFIVAENRTVSTGTLAAPTPVPTGIYNDLTVTASAVALLTDSTRVIGTLTVQAGGTLLTNNQPLVGVGSLGLAAGATLGIANAEGLGNAASPAIGAVKLTGTRNYSPGAAFLYDGTGPQVTGPGLPALVGALTVRNSAGLTLSQGLTTNTALALPDGELRTGAYTLTLGPTATVAESATGYLTGTLQTTRPVATAGATQDFGGLGLALTPAATSARLPGSTTVRRVTGTAPTGAGNVGVSRYFDIQAANSTGLDVTLQATYREAELNGHPEAKLVFFRATSGNSPAGPWGQQSGTYARDLLNHHLALAGIADLSLWALGDPAAPLPVELTSFTATAEGAAVHLAWHTASERNSARFEVERSYDGREFERIGAVAAQGSATHSTAYSYADGPAAQLLLYYRLRLVDTDGSATYSVVRTVRLSTSWLPGLSIFPNPARRLATLAVSAAPEARQVLLLDATGRTQRNYELPAGAVSVSLDLAGLAPGLYVVRCGAASARLSVE